MINLVADICKRNGIKKLIWSNNKDDRMPDTAAKVNAKIGAAFTAFTTQTATKKASFLPSRGYFMKGDSSPNVGKIASFTHKMFPSYTPEAALGNLYGINLIKATMTH